MPAIRYHFIPTIEQFFALRVRQLWANTWKLEFKTLPRQKGGCMRALPFSISLDRADRNVKSLNGKSCVRISHNTIPNAYTSDLVVYSPSLSTSWKERVSAHERGSREMCVPELATRDLRWDVYFSILPNESAMIAQSPRSWLRSFPLPRITTHLVTSNLFLTKNIY